MMRVASNPPCGPAASSSFAPAAFGLLAPEPAAPALSDAADGAGFGGLLAQPARPSDTAINMMTIIRCIRLVSNMLKVRKVPRPAHGSPPAGPSAATP